MRIVGKREIGSASVIDDIAASAAAGQLYPLREIRLMVAGLLWRRFIDLQAAAADSEVIDAQSRLSEVDLGEIDLPAENDVWRVSSGATA